MNAPRDPVARALSLPIWSGTPVARSLGGGITNLNVLVTDARRSAVVRIGDDIPVHQIMRFNELAASRAAHAATLSDGLSRHLPLLPGLLDEADILEKAVGRIELVFGHNDLLPANFLHDGRRMWLIDWDYAGWNSPLFDLGGLAANTGLDPEQEGWLLSAYYGNQPDADLWRRFRAMKAAAALREAMWSMVQEIHSDLAFDYAAYTADYLETYRAAWVAFRNTP